MDITDDCRDIFDIKLLSVQLMSQRFDAFIAKWVFFIDSYYCTLYRLVLILVDIVTLFEMLV